MTEGEVRCGAGMRVGSGNVFSMVPAKESKEMQGSSAAAAGGAPAKAINAAEMYPPHRAFKFTLLRVKAAEWSAGTRFFERGIALSSGFFRKLIS